MKHRFPFLLSRIYALLALLPIAGFIVLGLLELRANLRRGKDIAQTCRWILGFALGTTAVFVGAQLIQDKPPAAARMQQPVFEGVIEPILRRRCLDCHGAEKHRSQLRLDSLEACLQGGKNGPIIKPHQAKESPLIQRLLIFPDADGHMPPEDQQQPTAEEIALLEWWINAGAPATTKIRDLTLTPELRDCLKVVWERSTVDK
jgi:uncharacterized membrane protein